MLEKPEYFIKTNLEDLKQVDHLRILSYSDHCSKLIVVL
jgi:hypothetical protein